MDFDFDNEIQQIQIDSSPKQDNYYSEYCRLFLANIALTNQVKELIDQKNTYKSRLTKYQDDQGLSEFQRNQKAKRFRRNAHEIERFYKCSIKSCAKSYGSEGSLNQHYKLKHPEIYVTLPSVQSTLGTNRSMESRQYEDCLINEFQDESHSKVHSILKELGDINSFRSFKIDELKFEGDKYNQNKQNICSNIKQALELKFNVSGQKPHFINFMKKQESTLKAEDGNFTLKRSSRIIKKRDFNF